MKQAFNRSGQVILAEVPVPKCSVGGVLVKNNYSLISTGTELTSISSSKGPLLREAKKSNAAQKVVKLVKHKGVRGALDTIDNIRNQESRLGYSSAGIVVEVGKNVTDLSVGDRVAAAGAGYASHAEYIQVPKNLVSKVPNNVNMEDACFTTVGSIAMHGVRRAGATFGENVVVIGLGLVGMLTVNILKVAGVRVIGIDIDESRIKKAKKYGITCFDYTSDIEKNVKRLTEFGADAVIITASTKSNDPILLAPKLCRKKGRVIVVGNVGMNLDRGEFYKKEVDLLISTSYGPGRYDYHYEEQGQDYPIGYVRWTENRNMREFLRLLSEDRINLKPIKGNIFKLNQVSQAYKSLKSKTALTSIIQYDKKSLKKLTIDVGPKRRKVVGKIEIGVIGPGNLFQNVHLPNIKKIKDFHIRALCSASGKGLRVLARQSKANYVTTDYTKLLKDPKIDVIMICTRHNLHAELASECLKNDKHVFVEKPMAMDAKQLRKLEKIVKQSKAICFVGHNRRYSLFLRKVKNLFSQENTPWMINYRVSIGANKDSWIQDPKTGGGRIIGECSHFFDVFNFIVGSEPVSVNTTTCGNLQSNYLASDNFQTTLKYADGSVASLIYTSLGDPRAGKERLEISRGGKSAFLDDFTSLRFFGVRSQDIILKEQDKGHYAELLALGKDLHAGKYETKSAFSATDIAFMVDDQVKNRSK